MTDGGLGNIFDAVEESAADPAVPPGPDFIVAVQVPRSSLGAPQGVEVPVPTHLEIDGEVVARKVGPDERPGWVRLHLPAGFGDGATLRLRGQGGQRDGGRTGDLLLTVRLVDDPSGGRVRSMVLLALVVAIVIAGAMYMGIGH